MVRAEGGRREERVNDRVLVTGGGGFIGGHLVGGLLARGRRVTVLDNFVTGRRESLAGLRGDLEVVEGSVADRDHVARAMRGASAVAHLAALPSVPRSVERQLVRVRRPGGAVQGRNDARGPVVTVRGGQDRGRAVLPLVRARPRAAGDG